MDTSAAIPADLADARWTPEQAAAWHAGLPWLLGANFVPSTARNQLEMWQAETFDPDTIDRELGWAAGVGMTSMRVFLHDLCWQDDRTGFLDRIDRFLAIARRHGIGALLTIFDSCWHPYPRSGPQTLGERGVHNSGWLQSPGALALRDAIRFRRLEGYVGGVIGHFRDDRRIHGWDLWNEPCNHNSGTYGPRDLGERKGEAVEPLLQQTFRWARAARPSQPLTSGVWNGEWDDDLRLTPLQRLQIHASDIVSFHCYAPLAHTRHLVAGLRRLGRPLWCTEYMARPTGSTFPAVTPWLREQRIGAWNWGLVAGRTQTHLAWDTWRTPCDGEPAEWFHEVFRADGTPYREDEAAVLRRESAAARRA